MAAAGLYGVCLHDSTGNLRTDKLSAVPYAVSQLTLSQPEVAASMVDCSSISAHMHTLEEQSDLEGEIGSR